MLMNINHINFIAIKLQIFWQPSEQLTILIVLACSLQGRRDTDRMHYEFYIIVMNSWLHTFIYSIQPTLQLESSSTPMQYFSITSNAVLVCLWTSSERITALISVPK